jgi:hypothetical protein
MSDPVKVEKVVRISLVAKAVKRKCRKEDLHLYTLKDVTWDGENFPEFDPEWEKLALAKSYEMFRTIVSSYILAKPVKIKHYDDDTGKYSVEEFLYLGGDEKKYPRHSTVSE